MPFFIQQFKGFTKAKRTYKSTVFIGTSSEASVHQSLAHRTLSVALQGRFAVLRGAAAGTALKPNGLGLRSKS